VDDFMDKLLPDGVFVDVKGQVDPAAFGARGVRLWRL
jgi:hypothetical protein